MGKRHTVRDVRIFGGAFTVLCGGIGTLLLVRGRTVPGVVLVALAAYFLAGTVLAPRILAGPFAVWSRFSFVLGWVNSRILLGLFHVIAICPAGLIGRLRRHDWLDRTLDRTGKSYWHDRGPADGSRERYEKQF